MDKVLDSFYWLRAPQRKRPAGRKMEVLCLGFSRQGTDSLRTALEILGYADIYHSSVITTRQREDSAFWTPLLRRKLRNKAVPLQETIDFDSVLGNCQAVTDDPANILGQELMDYYPQAKVILTGRRDTNGWFQSAQLAQEEMFTWRSWMLSWFDVRLYYLWRMFAFILQTFFDGDIEEKGKVYARAHYVELEDHLNSKKRGYLEWSEDDGWEPLCQYLGKPIPKGPFPTSRPEDYTYELEKATADLMFPAKLKQGAFYVLVAGLMYYYGTTVWFVFVTVVTYLWTNGVVDPRGPEFSHEGFVAGNRA